MKRSLEEILGAARDSEIAEAEEMAHAMSPEQRRALFQKHGVDSVDAHVIAEAWIRRRRAARRRRQLRRVAIFVGVVAIAGVLLGLSQRFACSASHCPAVLGRSKAAR